MRDKHIIIIVAGAGLIAAACGMSAARAVRWHFVRQRLTAYAEGYENGLAFGEQRLRAMRERVREAL